MRMFLRFAVLALAVLFAPAANAVPANSWLQYITSRSQPYVYVAFGDSYVHGAGGVSFADDLRSQTGKVVIDIAVGGSTITDQLGQVQAVIGYLNGSHVRELCGANSCACFLAVS
jgi:hypothetical protein